MSVESSSNGAPKASNSDVTSFAERLQSKHADSHNPTIEEVVDEEDILHPPPSFAPAPSASTPNAAPTPLSEKARGKQRSMDNGDRFKPAASSGELDTQSEQMFPSLGSGLKPRAPGNVPVAWGSKKPAFVANGAAPRKNGAGLTSSAASSRPSTPISAPMTPISTNGVMHPRGAGHVQIPGKPKSDAVTLHPQHLLPRHQLKMPIRDLIQRHNKKSRATVEMKAAVDGGLLFEAKGPSDEAVHHALREIVKEVGSKQVVQIPVPSSARPYIIGRQGATINEIKNKSCAQITLPKRDESKAPHEDDDSSLDLVIEGDAIAVILAQREIEQILSQRTSNVTKRLRDVPAEFYAFLAGPHMSGIDSLRRDRDVQISIPTYHSWSSQPPPTVLSPDEVPNFVPHADNDIVLSGNMRAVQETKAEIERQVEELRKRIALLPFEGLSRGQYQSIIGPNGDSLQNLLKETGCSVILPPDSLDTETITIIGPREQLELAKERTMDLATSVQGHNVIIKHPQCKGPLAAQDYARGFTRFLQGHDYLSRLEKARNTRIVLPLANNNSTYWELYTNDPKNAINAKADIKGLQTAYPPSRFRHLEMDPFFHQHLQDHHDKRFRTDHGVQLILPGDSGSSEVVLVCEGLAGSEESPELPRQTPSPAQIAEFEQALQTVQNDILGIAAAHQPIGSREIQFPPKLHDKVHKFVIRDQQDVPGNLPVQLITKVQAEADSRKVSFDTPPSAEHSPFLWGPGDRLESLAEKIATFIEEEKRDEAERGFTMSFEFPQKFANYLIGRRGENINKLREEFDVDIQVNNGKVDLKGPKAKTENAKAAILEMGRKWQDEVTHRIKIDPRFHREMIGAKGAQVNRLQDRYNVKIQFPRSAQNGFDDASSDVSGATPSKNQGSGDEVVIFGPKKGADAARDELLSLAKYTNETSHTAIVSVARAQLPSLIGTSGKEIQSIRDSTGANINVPGDREGGSSNRVELKIRGTKAEVDNAKKLLEERAKVFDETISQELIVDKKYHRALIGSHGANIRNIVVSAGGSVEPREIARTVRFPDQQSTDSTVRIEGSKSIVEGIVAAIESFVSKRENEVVDNVTVAPEKHRFLIGPRGETRQGLESQLDVKIDIPKQTVQGAARSQIKLVGGAEQVRKAKEHILSLVKDQEKESVQVPRSLHHSIADTRLFSRLRAEYDVGVDHGGQSIPPRPSSSGQARANGSATLPLITDEQQDSVNNYVWDVVENDLRDDGSIPWILKGSTDNVSKAKAVIIQALEEAKAQTSTGYLILPDPKTYRFVIGPGGAKINEIRAKTGCRIMVPRNQASGEAIEVVGGREGVDAARDYILEAVRHGNGRRRS